MLQLVAFQFRALKAKKIEERLERSRERGKKLKKGPHYVREALMDAVRIFHECASLTTSYDGLFQL